MADIASTSGPSAAQPPVPGTGKGRFRKAHGTVDASLAKRAKFLTDQVEEDLTADSMQPEMDDPAGVPQPPGLIKGKGHGKGTASGGTFSATGRDKSAPSSGHPAEGRRIIAADHTGMSDDELWHAYGVWALNFLPSQHEQHCLCHVYQGLSLIHI